MKILLIGSGGREHALAWKLDQSTQVNHIFVAPGNAGTEAFCTNVSIDPMAFEEIISFSKEEAIDLVVVGPEDPLVGGLVDALEGEEIKVFGPNKACAQFEGSKRFTKEFLMKYDVPTAGYLATTDYEEGAKYIEEMTFPVVIKTDGLYKGKGVVIVEDEATAKEILFDMLEKNSFGEAGQEVVIEEFLEGEEQSLLCFVSNNKIIPMETARDYKKIGEGDVGENTGGVGTYSPSGLIDEETSREVRSILDKISDGLDAEELEFNGILFVGFMMTDQGSKVLEFNVRFGDPETEVLMPRLKSDLITVFEKTLNGTLSEADLSWSDQTSLAVIHFSKGYPGNYEKGVAITELPDELTANEIIFHNGTVRDEKGQLVTNGGRVLTSVGIAPSLEEARNKAYVLASHVKGESLDYRRDIGL